MASGGCWLLLAWAVAAGDGAGGPRLGHAPLGVHHARLLRGVGLRHGHAEHHLLRGGGHHGLGGDRFHPQRRHGPRRHDDGLDPRREAPLPRSLRGGDEEPVIDSSQDCTLLSLTQNGTHTFLKFRRPFRTCDPQDMDITEDTMRLIYACSNSLPASPMQMAKHERVFGVISLQILNYGRKVVPNMGNSSTLDIVTNFSVPQVDSFYSCKLEQFPAFGRKLHVYMVEPVIKTSVPSLLYQMVLYSCPSSYDQSRLSSTTDCFLDGNSTALFTGCVQVIAIWGIGTKPGQSLIYPDEAGFSLGAEGDPNFYVLQVHYDNRGNRKGVMDYSGFRLHLTPELRKYDAGILWTGIALFHTLLIPAPVAAYRTYGYCDTRPLSQSPNQTVGPLKVIGGYLHTHLLGSRLRVLHFRAGKQIGVLLQDQTFDPALQEPKFLLEPATVERGDVLITECTFNTRQRAEMVIGGLDTVNEMCMSFLVYYPRIDIEGCLSFQNASTVAAALGVTASSDDELYRILDARSWSAEQAADMEARVRDASQSLFIVGDPDIREGQVKMPEIPEEETTPCVRTLDAGAPARTGLPVVLLLTALVSWVCCGGV